MPDDFAPSGSSAAGSTPAGTDAAFGGSQSVGVGNAPGVGGDSGFGGQQPQGQPSDAQPGQYLFRGRSFRDQRHAEEVLGGEVDRVRGVQRQNSEYQQQLQAQTAELQALRGLLAQGQFQGQGQGSPQAFQGGGGSQSFAERLATSGDLDFISQLAEEKGFGHAMFEMARLMEQHTQEQIQGIRDQEITPFIQNFQLQQGVTQLLSSVKPILAEFPELEVDSETSPEVAEAQEYVLNRVKDLPPEWLAQNGPSAIRSAILEYRHLYGTPNFAHPAGSSGSPSSYALAAAERGGTTPLNGPGTPPWRPGNGQMAPQDRLRMENQQINARTLRTPSGRPLWTPVA